MTAFSVGAIIGAAISSLCWWLYVRKLSGVISDLNDVVKDANVVAAKIKP